MTNPTITALPPVPTRNDAPAAFVDKADAFLGALPQFQAEANALGAAIEADAAQTAADRVQTGLDRASATASASSALNAPGTSGTSTTSLLIGAGTKSFTTQAGKAWSVGQGIVIASTTSPLNQMSGVMTAYNASTGAMTVEVAAVGGSGTFAAWTVSLAAGAAMAVASQAEAEAGTDNGKVMTPLRTFQEINTHSIQPGSTIMAFSSPGPRFILADGSSYLKVSYPTLAAILGDRYAAYSFATPTVQAGYDLPGIYAEPGLAIISGTNGLITTTTDGVNFTNRTLLTTNFSYGLGAVKAATKYFLYGVSNPITQHALVSSANGVTGWADVASFGTFPNGSGAISCMAYGMLNGVPTLVALGGSGGGNYRVRYSTNEGAAWTDGPAVSASASGDPANQLVFIANGVIATYANQELSRGTSPSVLAPVPLGTLNTFGLGDNLFVAVRSTGVILTSPDCAAWTQRYLPVGMTGVQTYLGYVNGGHIFDAQVDGSSRFYGTADFVTWYRVNLPGSVSVTYGPTLKPFGNKVLQTATYASGGGLIAVGSWMHNPATEFPTPNLLDTLPIYIKAY